MKNRCESCGAPINRNEECCPYCNTAYPRESIEPKKIIDTSAFSGLKLDVDSNDIDETKKGKINVVVFILLLVFSWPVAVIYAIICSAKKKA